MMKTKIALLCSLMLLSMLACNSSVFTPTPLPTVNLDELQFKDPETGRRFRDLDRCIRNIVDDSWHTTSYQTGNSYTSKWCHGTGTDSDCPFASGNVDDRDQRVIVLYTQFYPQSPTDVFGLGFNSRWVPKSTGWGASYHFNENGDGSGGWGVTFSEYTTPAGEPQATVNLGWSYGYTFYDSPDQTTFEHPSDLPMREDLALYLSTPDTMRDRGLVQNQALAQKVITAITEHQVNTCDRGPYLGDGIQPACTPRPLTTSEEADELSRAESYFAEQEQLLRDHYQEMYAAWMAGFPLDQCWP